MHTFTTDIAAMRHDGRLGKFVYFVKEDDAALALRDIVIGSQEKAFYRGLDISPNVSRLCERRTVNRREGDFKDPRQGREDVSLSNS